MKKTREQAKELLYKHCKDKAVNDGKSLYYLGAQEDNVLNAIEDALKLSSKQIMPLSLKMVDKLKKGDVFLWQSGMTGRYEIHMFHSDSGYGAKTFTDFNEKDGSSLLVNYSGVRGVFVKK